MSNLISRCKLFNKLATVQTLAEAYAVIQGMETEDAIPIEWILEQAKKRDKAVASILMLTVQEWEEEKAEGAATP